MLHIQNTLFFLFYEMLGIYAILLSLLCIFFKSSQKWCSYVFQIFRQFIARTILDTLRLVTDTPEDVEAVLKVMNKLADDVGKSCWWM